MCPSEQTVYRWVAPKKNIVQMFAEKVRIYFLFIFEYTLFFCINFYFLFLFLFSAQHGN